MKTRPLILLVAILSLAGGWWIGHRSPASANSTTAGRKILYYQSTMHPWVKSDKPGKCTVCGMDLVPVYEGGTASPATARTHLVMLPEGAPQVASISTATIRREKLTRTLHFAGTIDDDDSRHRILSAYTGGRIEKLFVNYEGAEVEAGQPLALFYSRELLAAAREYTLARQQNNAAIAAVGATRLQQMGLTAGQIAQVPSRPEKDLFFEILAPISGTVVKRFAYEGQYVAEGEKLMEIADFSTMWLQFSVYEQDLPFLRLGQNVEITLPSLPGKTLTAPVTFINPNLDEMTRSARVRVDIPNPTSDSGLHRQHELLHKTYALANVLAELPEVLTVPRSAVLWPAKQPRVYVEKSPGTYEQRVVSLGRPGNDAWEVLDGLAEGERVVVSGNMLIDGQAQINSLAAPETPMPMGGTMPQGEHEATRAYLTAVTALGEALAADKLDAYQAAIALLPVAPAGFPSQAPEGGSDLASARRAFQPFSAAVSVASQKIRGHFPELKVFSCPMSNMAGLPKNAQWVQLSPSIHNPYLGQEMLDCGSEVPPETP